jgi:hypothetical protein
MTQNWGVKPGQPVPIEKRREMAKQVLEGLVFFAVIISTDPEKKKALARLQELRLEIQEQLDILAPGWADVEASE